MNLHIISSINPDQFVKSSLASNRLRLNFLYDAALQLGLRVTSGLNIPEQPCLFYFGKITKEIEEKKLLELINKLNNNKSVILVDYTDDWLDATDGKIKRIYQKLMKVNSTVIVPINGLKEKLNKIGKETLVIPDAIDNITAIAPTNKNNKIKNVLWHGHSSNIRSLIRIISTALSDYEFTLHIVSNANSFEIIKKTDFKITPKCNIVGHIWSLDKLHNVSRKSDFAILPTNKKWASANRLITTFMLGLPVIAETISSYEEYSKYYSDFSKNQIIEMFNFPEKSYNSVEFAQKKIKKDFEPKRLLNLWKMCLENNLN